jgi:sterol desaturase/sphingolipid hydroxylase (fatty acid hydroxylase superfamily)
LSAASLPAAAASSPSLALAAAPSAATIERAAVAATKTSPEVSPAAPTTEARRDVASLETLARPAAANGPQPDVDGAAFFDFARRPIASAFAVAGMSRGAASQLEPRDSAANSRTEQAAQPPAPAPSKLRTRVKQILWGAGALAFPVLTFAWMPLVQSNAANSAPVAAFTDLGAIARGVAFAGPLILLGVWEAAKLYRSKHPGSLSWMGRVTVAATDLHKPLLPRLNHYLTNLAFGAVGIALVATFAGPHVNDWNHFLDAHNVGLLRWLHVGGWKNIVASITILDFMGWWWHYAYHRIPLFWRLHKVHHSDIEYNFSTTYRTHWLEMLTEIGGRMAMYALVGPTLLAITIYEIIILGLSQYQHANIKMPTRLEAILSKLFMSSHKHFIHHSMDADDYDTNFGFIFVFWDKLFGTFKNYAPEHLTNNITTGIREYPRAKDLTFLKLLWMPFRSQSYEPKEKP